MIYDSATGNLSVVKEGDGAMEDYTFNSAPWHDPAICINVTSINIGDGVTHVGSY